MSISGFERWYASQCDGFWEHGHGIKIETLDNPGWSVKIDLRDTTKEHGALDRKKIARSDNDWITYCVEQQQFRIACGPLSLSEAVEIFMRWFDSKTNTYVAPDMTA
jgi:hypothetical protein